MKLREFAADRGYVVLGDKTVAPIISIVGSRGGNKTYVLKLADGSVLARTPFNQDKYPPAVLHQLGFADCDRVGSTTYKHTTYHCHN